MPDTNKVKLLLQETHGEGSRKRCESYWYVGIRGRGGVRMRVVLCKRGPERALSTARCDIFNPAGVGWSEVYRSLSTTIASTAPDSAWAQAAQSILAKGITVYKGTQCELEIVPADP